MDEQDQAEAYASADWSASHGKIPDYFRERFPTFKRGPVLDLGCGPADVTIRFARAFPEVTILGVDGSEAMLSFGRRYVHEAGLDSRVVLEKRYLPDPALESGQFDAVICNSLLHHLSDPLVMWQSAARCAKPHAPVLIVDLLRPADAETAARLVAENAEGAPPVLVRDFVASLHAAYTLDEVREQLKTAGLSGFRVEQPDELHLLVWGETPTE